MTRYSIKHLFDSIHRQIVSSFCRCAPKSLQNCFRGVHKSRFFAGSRDRTTNVANCLFKLKLKKCFRGGFGAPRGFPGHDDSWDWLWPEKIQTHSLPETKVWHLFNLEVSEICWRHLGMTPKVTPNSITLGTFCKLSRWCVVTKSS